MFIITWEFVINFLESALFVVAANAKYLKRQYNHPILKQLCFLASKAMTLTLFNINNIPTVFIITFSLLTNFIFLMIFFKNNIFTFFFISFIFSLLLILSDAITILIPCTLFNIDITQILYSGNLRIPFSLIYISIVALFVIIYLLFSPKVFILGTFDKISFFILSAACIILEELVLISLLEQSNHNTVLFKLLLFMFGLSMFLFIYFSIYVYRLGKEKEKNSKLIEEITINKMEIKQNDEIINSIRNLRSLKHDIVNHMSVLTRLIEANENTAALQYITQINSSVESTSYTISTGITSIDCIMTAKLSTALNSNIAIEHQIHFPSLINITDMDLCSLLGNLLDNAIEACRKLDEDKRKLQIEIKPYNNMLSIYLLNSSDGNYYYNPIDGSLLTSKNKEKNEHGIGLKRIMEIVEKYDGIIDISPNENTFSISILVPIKK